MFTQILLLCLQLIWLDVPHPICIELDNQNETKILLTIIGEKPKMNPFYDQFSSKLSASKPASQPAATPKGPIVGPFTNNAYNVANMQQAQGGGMVGPFSRDLYQQAGAINTIRGQRASGGPSGFTGGQPGVADIAAQQKAAQVGNLRNEIIERRSRANSIFEALTGAVQALAQEKRGTLEQDFSREAGRAQEDYTETSGQLSRAYAGRGLGDSSYRINALDRAGADYGRTVEDLGNQRQSALGQLGGETVGALARIGADREASNAFNLDELGDDVESLMALRNKLDERIRQAGVQQAEFGTQSGFKGRLGGIAANTQAVGVLKSSLQNLLQTAVPKSTKDKIAQALINNYAPEEGTVWQEFWNQESQKAPVAG